MKKQTDLDRDPRMAAAVWGGFILGPLLVNLLWITSRDVRLVDYINSVFMVASSLVWALLAMRLVSLKKKLEKFRAHQLKELNGNALPNQPFYRFDEFGDAEIAAYQKSQRWFVLFCFVTTSIVGWIFASFLGFKFFWR